MKIVLATSNKGKVAEIAAMLKQYEVLPYSDLIAAMDIVEDADTFAGNAVIKAKAVATALPQEGFIVLSDDSGLVVPALGGEPGLFSARFAGENATDADNRAKLMSELSAKNIQRTPAHYVAAIAVSIKGQIYTTHGWMYGEVLNEQRGEGGFGYDPLFIPSGYSQTLGELEFALKQTLSHRAKAVELARAVIEVSAK